jgi:hypothetical protein
MAKRSGTYRALSDTVIASSAFALHRAPIGGAWRNRGWAVGKKMQAKIFTKYRIYATLFFLAGKRAQRRLNDCERREVCILRISRKEADRLEFFLFQTLVTH